MATIKDITRLVGVSSATVSRVLSGDESFSISEEKRLSIINAARQLGYKTPRQRNSQFHTYWNLTSENGSIADSISHKALTIINFLSPDDEINDPYYTSIRMGIEQACIAKRISIKITFLDNFPHDRKFLSKSIGVIAIGPIPPEEISEIRRQNENIVLIDPVTATSQLDLVTYDRSSALRELFLNITRSGAKDIVLIDHGDEKLLLADNVESQNGKINSHFEKINFYSIQEGYDAALRILKSAKVPDVIVTANDIVAIGVLRALHEQGVQVPEDVGVIGINDIDIAKDLSPPLTTLKLYAEEMGQTAVMLLLERMEGRKIEKKITIGHRFIWRESFKSDD